MQQKCNWAGLDFHILQHSVDWPAVAGIYIFARRTASGWLPLYIGQASSFKDRLPCHERWAEARRKFATHVHALAVDAQKDRDAIEKRLIQLFQPELNKLLKAQPQASKGLGLLQSQPRPKVDGLLNSSPALRGVSPLPTPPVTILPPASGLGLMVRAGVISAAQLGIDSAPRREVEPVRKPILLVRKSV